VRRSEKRAARRERDGLESLYKRLGKKGEFRRERNGLCPLWYEALAMAAKKNQEGVKKGHPAKSTTKKNAQIKSQARVGNSKSLNKKKKKGKKFPQEKRRKGALRRVEGDIPSVEGEGKEIVALYKSIARGKGK